MQTVTRNIESQYLVNLGLLSFLTLGGLTGAYQLTALHWGFSHLRQFVSFHVWIQFYAVVLPIFIGMGLRLFPPSPWVRRRQLEQIIGAFMAAGLFV